MRWIITTTSEPNLQFLKDENEQILFEKIKSQISTEREFWNSDHDKNEYQNVFSITDDPEVCSYLSKNITHNMTKILIPGCGSKTHLQEYLIKYYPNITIYCTDWSLAALRQAETICCHPNIIYQQEDSGHFSFSDNFFDQIIISNSILSNHDLLNRRIIKECYRVIKRNGNLCGFFPTIFCAFEWAHLDNRYSHFLTNNIINFVKNSLYETTQQCGQIFYTPLRLQQIFNETGFKRKTFEIYFFDNDYFKKENEKIYGLPPDSGLCVYEFFVLMEKND